jgi:hypothetical protein
VNVEILDGELRTGDVGENVGILDGSADRANVMEVAERPSSSLYLPLSLFSFNFLFNNFFSSLSLSLSLHPSPDSSP